MRARQSVEQREGQRKIVALEQQHGGNVVQPLVVLELFVRFIYQGGLGQQCVQQGRELAALQIARVFVLDQLPQRPIDIFIDLIPLAVTMD